MFGIEVILQNGTVASGVLFPDGSVYVHEPVVDTWSSVDNMLAEEHISHYEVLDAFMPVERAKQFLRDDYNRVRNQMNDALDRLQRDYKACEALYAQYASTPEKAA